MGETDLGDVWRLLDEQVAAGRMPGYVAAVRHRGHTEVRVGGRTAHEPGSPPTGPDSLFRIASLTKPIGAALTLSLVQDGVLGLDDPVGPWLPEAAHPRVLVDADGPLDRTVDAPAPITVRHLLAMTCGWGVVLTPSPLQEALQDSGAHPGPLATPLTGDEFAARLTALPLAFPPGAGWLYDSGTDLLGLLLARATGTPVSTLMAERVTGPLGMTDTAFGAVDPSRLTTAYRPGPDGPELLDPPDGVAARPPAFERLSSGLVSTAPDVLRFFTAMADGPNTVLTAGSLAAMTVDALTPAQRRQAAPILGAGASWGLGTAVDVEVAAPWQSVGRWGWNGGTGTTAFVDPARDTVAVLLTQRGMAGPQDAFDDFWTTLAASTEPTSAE